MNETKQGESTDIGHGPSTQTHRQSGFIDYMKERIWQDFGIPHIQLYIDPKTDFTDCPASVLHYYDKVDKARAKYSK